MARTYRLKLRAERQDETRQRIVEAAVALHTTVGPLRTSVSAIAERAGVQRHTFYRHFPDERSLGLSCSSLWFKRHPLPELNGLAGVADAGDRLRRGLGTLYAYYEENAEDMAPIVRDAAIDPLIQELSALHTAATFETMRGLLVAPFGARGARRRRLDVALRMFMDFNTWQALRANDAVEIAVRAICAQ
jgi:AcrR family transcriptional regulator